MVKLTRYRAQQGLATPGTPDVRESAYQAQALEAFGSQLTKTASHFGAILKDRQTRRQKFEADAAFNQWKGGVGTALDDATFNMEPGANGFAGGFMSGTFETSAADFLAQLEKITDDPEILDFYRNAVEMERTRVGGAATEAERKEMVRFQTDHINTLAEEQIGLLVTDPDSYDTVTTGLHGLIDASNLPAIERAELHKQVDVAAAEGLLAAYADDPLKQFELLGGDWDKLSPDAQGKLMTEALGEVPAPLASALEQLSGARSGFDTTKPQVQERWVSDVPPEQLGMIGGAGQSGSSIIAQGHNTSYGDYSMAFRVVSFDRAAAGGANAIKVGERNGRAVWAAPGYYRDPKTGDIVTHVSAAQAAQLARDNGGLIMTKGEFAEFQRQTTEVQFQYQKGPDGGPATNQPGKGDGKASSDYYLKAAGDAMQTGVWGMKEMVVSGNTVPVAMPVVMPGPVEQKGGVAYGIVRVGEYNMNLADAIRIGRKIDPGAPKSMSPKVWAEYMTDPVLSQAYAQAFFAEALEANGGDRAAAYVQFFLGDERAAEWNEGGRKAGDLPRGVSEAMGGITGAAPRGVMNPPSMRPEDIVFFTSTDDAGNPIPMDPTDYDEIDPRLVSAVRQSFAQLGIRGLPVKDAERYEVGGGAGRSQHLIRMYPGESLGAFDFSMDGLSEAQKIGLIATLSANGVKGIGVYSGNTLHVDVRNGPRQAWGDSYNYDDTVPKWAREVLQAHLDGAFANGYAPRGTPVGGRGYAYNGNKIRDGIIDTASALGMDPIVLATIMYYETGGTMDPMKFGPTTQWGRHRGFIQFGEPQAKQHGVDFSSRDAAIASQLGPNGAIVSYFLANGWKPGMSELDAYSIVNAGGPGRYEASDANNGGAPGTVRDKVEQQFGPHRRLAEQLLGGDWSAQAQGRGYTGAGDPRLAGLPAKRRAAALEDALTAINGKAPTLTDQRASAKLSLDDEIARMEQTGSFSEGFDLNAALAPLTVGDQDKYAMKAELAAWTHEVNKVVPSWSEEYMVAQLNAYDKPLAPGEYKSPLQQEKEKIVREAIEAEQDARKRDPAEASLNLEDVASAWADISVALGSIPKGFGILEALSTPGTIEDLRSNAMAVVRFIDKSVATQVQHFGMNPTGIKHLPVDLLKQIGRDINTLLTLPDRDGKLRENDIALFMVAAKAIFGRYADEVILEAIEIMDDAPENIEGSAHQKLYDAVKENPKYFSAQAEIVRKLKEKASGANDPSDPDPIPALPTVPDDPIEDTASVPPTAHGDIPQGALMETLKMYRDSGFSAEDAYASLVSKGLDPIQIERALEAMDWETN